MEILRRTVRTVIQPNSLPYRMASDAIWKTEVLRKEGWGTLSDLKRLQRGGQSEPYLLNLKTLRHPIAIRPTEDDVATILNNVIRAEYGRYAASASPRTLIDAGAFIGDTSAWFLSRHPGMQVIALEPQDSNFELASRNLKPYGSHVRLEKKALSNQSGTVSFGGESVHGAIGQGELHVEATSVPDLLKHLPGQRCDILKMDIEGAELDVLGPTASDWLDRIDMVVAELHGPEITRAVTQRMTGAGFLAKSYRSLTYFARKFI